MLNIIFDFDGVIADSRDLAYDIHNRIADKYGLSKINSPDDYLNVIDDYNWNKLVDQATIENYYNICNKEYAKRMDSISLYPFMEKLLKDHDINVAIITSTYSDFVRKILHNNGIDKDIEILGKETRPSKKERFELYIKNNQINKNNVVYIGDTIHDYLFCESVGIRMIGCNYGYSNLKSIESKLMKLVNSDQDLYDYLRKINDKW